MPFVEEERLSLINLTFPKGHSSLTGMTITVEGTADPVCSGKFAQDGLSDDVPKYTNTEGITLFRARLHETPELDITKLFLDKEAPGMVPPPKVCLPHRP